MGWNGLDLVSDFSAELGDVSGAFKTKVLRWINEGIKDIATNHNWEFLREKGELVLQSGIDTHPIVLEKPDAPTATLTAGGSLTADTLYRALITYYEEVSGVESIAGEIVSITPTGTDLSFQLEDIPFSSSPLVTERRIYVSKSSGSFQYHGRIANNLEEIPGTPDPEVDPPTPITYDVTSDPSSPITPPEEHGIHMIDGEFYIEGQRIINGTSLQDLIFKTGSVNSSGTPEMWAPINQEEIRVYPKPSTDTTVSFYYFKLPSKVFALITSIPQIPSWLFHDLRNYVMWRGYDYRDRAGKESKKLNYEQDLRTTISRKGKATKKSGKIRSVTPDSDGMVY